MHFNTKYILTGDSASEIRKKINYNFDQIISFAIGPDGHQGPKGPDGYDGPAGHKGLTGLTGLRGTIWYKQDDQPGNSSNPFDLWIDSNTSDYQVNSKGTTGAWSYTGYSLFTSPYFASYDGIIGPAGVTDKYAIGIKSGVGLAESLTSLIVGDLGLGTTGANPNRSKLLVSTEDQTARPIFTFSKTGAISSGVPAFYWRTSGASASLRYNSTGGLEISSLLGLSVDSYTARALLYGNYANITSTQSVTIGGTGDFYLFSNTTVGQGGNFAVESTTMRLTSSLLSLYRPTKISTTSTTAASGFVLDTTKNLPSGTTISARGIELYAADSTPNALFEFRDLKDAPIFSASPRGSLDSGKHSQVTFGSTGGATAGATGGPYFYHVKRVKEVRGATTTVTCRAWTGTTITWPPGPVYNVMDLSSTTLWDSDVILVTPTSFTFASNNYVFIRIPSSYSTNLDGVYSGGYANKYRIFLNDITTSSSYVIAGLVYDYFTKAGTNIITNTALITFNAPGAFSTGDKCLYVDITYLAPASTTNGNPRVFWKTCNGVSGFINLSNLYSIGSIVSTAPTYASSLPASSLTAKGGIVSA
jgi:hypothetical protein